MTDFLYRCIDLAQMGDSSVAPNPRVGAVVEHKGLIIGEGFHKRYGEAHAEVNAINGVKDKSLLPEATLYVSLEPCNHYGKTPPCTELILNSGIRRVVVGCLDPNPLVSGQGVQRLKDHGVAVEVAEDQTPFQELNKFFFLNQAAQRPYILLKWAETSDGYIGQRSGKRLQISEAFANRYVHYTRSVYQAILVGRTTARLDDPRLSVRFYYGNAPTRIVFDYDCTLPRDLNIFTREGKVIIINQKKNAEEDGRIFYFKPERDDAFVDLELLMKELYARYDIGSILVEGGRYIMQQFINQNLFDEIQVIRSPKIIPSADVAAPVLPYHFHFDRIDPVGDDMLFTKTIRH